MKVFDTGKLPQDMKDIYDSQFECIEHACKVSPEGFKPMPEVRPYYIPDWAIGAQISSYKKKGIDLGISAALPAVINFYFNNLLRTKKFLKKVGDSQIETPLSGFRGEIPTEMHQNRSLEDAIGYFNSMSRPADPKRENVAWQLTFLALRFICYHEVSHIELGHFGACKLLFGSNHFFEFWGRKKKISKDNVEVLRVWEYEADLSAAFRLMTDFTDPWNIKTLAIVLEVDEPSAKYSVFGALISAIFCVFHLFHEREKLEGSDLVHPLPLVRFGYILRTSISFYCNRVNGLNEHELYKAGMNAAYDTYYYWKEYDIPIEEDMWNSNHSIFWEPLYQEGKKLEESRLLHYKKYYKNAIYYPFKEFNQSRSDL